ncbi:Transcription initiation factor TFIID subunit 9, partial [Tulasnella sp. 427]
MTTIEDKARFQAVVWKDEGTRRLERRLALGELASHLNLLRLSTHMPPDVLPRDARLIALLISSCPSITDAQPAVLHQLLEFAHRYTAQVLSDALVYSEHAGRGGAVDEEDVKLAVQSRVGWEFGGKIPKE